MSIVDFLRSPKLFGAMPEFADLSSWRGWIAILKAVEGLRMNREERATVERLTGRTDFAEGRRFRRALFCTGRQCGKSRISSLLQTHAALTEGRPGLYYPVLAQDRQAAQRVLLSYVREALNSSPALSAEIASETADSIVLRNGSVLAVYPNRPESLRGIRGSVVADEIAFASQGFDGRDKARDIVVAAEPCTATVDGRIVLLSSPGRTGDYFHQLVKRHFGVDGSEWLIVRAAAPDLNPNLSAAYLRRMAEDPAAYRTEVLGDWSEGSGQCFDEAALQACVVPGRREIEPHAVKGKAAMFVDPASGGKGGDRFGCAVGFRDGERVVVAALRSFVPPFSFRAVVQECADLAKSFSIRTTHGDRYTGSVIVEAFRECGLAYEPAAASSSELFLDAVGPIQSGVLELPDPACSDRAEELLADLRSVIRKPGIGRDRADVPRGTGRYGHGDLGAAVVGLVSILPAKREKRKFSIAGFGAINGDLAEAHAAYRSRFGPILFRRRGLRAHHERGRRT